MYLYFRNSPSDTFNALNFQLSGLILRGKFERFDWVLHRQLIVQIILAIFLQFTKFVLEFKVFKIFQYLNFCNGFFVMVKFEIGYYWYYHFCVT
jgi:hypothetical protein